MNSRARTVTISSVLISLASVAALHFVRTDLGPASHRLSEYATGPYGWMMTSAFIALSCGLLAFGFDLWMRSRRNAIDRLCISAVVVATVGTMLSGVFRTGGSDLAETVHSRASAIAVVALVTVALVYSIPLRNPSQDTDRVGVTLAVVAATLALLSPVFHHTRWTGLSQRLLWVVLLAWLLRAAWKPALGGSVAGHSGHHAEQQDGPGEETAVAEYLEQPDARRHPNRRRPKRVPSPIRGGGRVAGAISRWSRTRAQARAVTGSKPRED
jgi:hypothetical protein